MSLRAVQSGSGVSLRFNNGDITVEFEVEATAAYILIAEMESALLARDAYEARYRAEHAAKQVSS